MEMNKNNTEFHTKEYDYDKKPLLFRNFRSNSINVHGVWNSVYVVKSKVNLSSDWGKVYSSTSTIDTFADHNYVSSQGDKIINNFLDYYFPFYEAKAIQEAPLSIINQESLDNEIVVKPINSQQVNAITIQPEETFKQKHAIIISPNNANLKQVDKVEKQTPYILKTNLDYYFARLNMPTEPAFNLKEEKVIKPSIIKPIIKPITTIDTLPIEVSLTNEYADDIIVQKEIIEKHVVVERDIPVKTERKVYVPVEINKPFEVINEVKVPVFVEKPYEVIKQVPVEVIKEVPVEINVPFEVVKEINVPVFIEKPVEVIKEVIKEVPVEIIKEVEREVVKEIPIEIEKEVPVKVEVIKEVNVPVFVEKPVEVIKEVIKQVPVDVVKEVIKEIPIEITKEIIKEVPVEVIKEIIKEVEVIKPIEIEHYQPPKVIEREKLVWGDNVQYVEIEKQPEIKQAEPVTPIQIVQEQPEEQIEPIPMEVPTTLKSISKETKAMEFKEIPKERKRRVSRPYLTIYNGNKPMSSDNIIEKYNFDTETLGIVTQNPKTIRVAKRKTNKKK